MATRDEALRSLHRHRTNVAIPLDLADIIGSSWKGVPSSTVPLLDDSGTNDGAMEETDITRSLPAPRNDPRDPGHLDTPYTNLEHMPPDATRSPSPEV